MEAEQPLADTKGNKDVPLSWLARIKYWLFAKVLQQLVNLRMLTRSLPANKQPTFTKQYSGIGPSNTPVRVFIPPNYQSGGKLPPLWIDVHGGGFTLCDPRVDDVDNALLSYKHGFCVVSIPYRKAPDYPFPIPTHDCAAFIKAVLADDSIPGDRNRVIVGGYSAGGNLSLSAVQLDGLHEKVSAIVAYYPVVNYTLTLEEKLATSLVAPGKKRDMLEDLGPMFNWAYLPPGTNRKDPLLSPAFAERTKLPRNLCVIGCQYDLLCPEARAMAQDLAKYEQEDRQDTKTGWTKGDLKWMEIEGVEHRFNQTVPKTKEEGARLRATAETMHQEVVDWLDAHVLSK